ncbi:MAG: hypothetical protein IT380_09585 [Myxococcales bacterium]|nr:hypothetical protein [Myxococcales bacterium]
MRLGHWGAVAGVFACTAWCATARAEFFTPLEPVPPDGFEIRSSAPVTAQGASISPLGPQSFRVVPEPGARQVVLSAGAERRTLNVGPPATTVSASVTPVAPVKGRDAFAELEIVVGDAAGSAPPVLRANVGTLGPVERLGPGRYKARYALPPTRYPEVAVIVAFSAWPHPQSIQGAIGVLRVPLATAVEVPGRTEPGAQMRLTIAGTTFGPVTAGSDGSFRLPVVVPPGYGSVVGETRDRVGNRRKSTIDLRLPPTDQLACVATPTRLPADGASRARVLCATSDRFGAAARGARVQLTSSLGTLSPPKEVGPGLFEWTWVAPSKRGEGKARLDAKWRQGASDSGERLEIELGQGPVAALIPPPGEVALFAGGIWTGDLEARDALDRPVRGVQASASASVGTLRASPSEADGKLRLTWRLPADARRGQSSAEVRAFGPTSDEPARLLAWAEGGRTFAAVTDLAGLPVGRQRLLLDAQPFTTGEDGTVELPLRDGEHVLRHADWAGLQHRLVVQGGALIYPTAERPPRVTLKLPALVAPPVPINVRLEREAGGVRWWLESADGATVPGREVQLSVNGQVSAATSGQPSHLAVTAGSVGVVDVATRVSAAVEVAP